MQTWPHMVRNEVCTQVFSKWNSSRPSTPFSHGKCKRVTNVQHKMSSAILNYKSKAFDSHGLSFQDAPHVPGVHAVFVLRWAGTALVLDTVREVDLRFATDQTGNGVKLNEHIQPKWSTSCGCWRPLRHISVNITGNTTHGWSRERHGWVLTG